MAVFSTLNERFQRLDERLPGLFSSRSVLSRGQFLLLTITLAACIWIAVGRGLPPVLLVLLGIVAAIVVAVLVAKRLRHAGLPVAFVLLLGLPILGWFALVALTAFPGKRPVDPFGWRVTSGAVVVIVAVTGLAHLLPVANPPITSGTPQTAHSAPGSGAEQEDLDATRGQSGESTRTATEREQPDFPPGASDANTSFESGRGNTIDIPLGRGDSLLARIGQLSEAPEAPEGYDRDLFRHWTDADGNGCNTREEVLIAESLTAVTVGSACAISGGRWSSVFDGSNTDDPSAFDVDHLVPLKEAWSSGAHAWDDNRRQLFANDLDYPGSLIAVSSSSNRSKEAKDPANWLPPNEQFVCVYIETWVEVKIRWGLAADALELAALRDVGSRC